MPDWQMCSPFCSWTLTCSRSWRAAWANRRRSVWAPPPWFSTVRSLARKGGFNCCNRYALVNAATAAATFIFWGFFCWSSFFSGVLQSLIILSMLMHAMKKCLSWTSAVCPARNISTTTGLIVMKFEIQKRKPFWVTVTTMRLACLVLDVSTSMWWINIEFATDNHVSIRMNFNHCGDGRSFYSSSIIKSDFSLFPNTLIITNKPIPW